jgi:hypothetical protein
MSRRVKIFIKLFLLLLIFVISAYCLIFFTLGSRFEHNYQSGNYIVYSESEITEPGTFITEIDQRLKSCELFNETVQKIYIFDSETDFNFYAKLSFVNPSQAFNNHLFDKIFLNKPFIERTRTERAGAGIVITHSALEGNIIEIAAHEIIHSFVYHKLGKQKASSLPFWKQEGYPEYTANIFPKKNDSTYNFFQRIALLNAVNYWEGPKEIRDYYEAEVLVEYLMDVKKIKFNELVSDSVTYEMALSELDKWKSAHHDSK